MKNCKLCGFSKVCNDIPGWCLILQYAAIAGVIAGVTYLLATGRFLGHGG